MSALTLMRGLSGLALPVLAYVTWRSRRDPQSSSDIESDSTAEHMRRPTRREISAMVKSGEDLSGLDLRGFNLKGFNLSGRRLAGTDLSRARMTGARMSETDLSDATLDFADLSRCDLRKADMTRSSLLETSFWDADLSGADLTGSKNIVMANLKRARYSPQTRWPGGLDPRSLGAQPIERPKR